MKIAISSQFLFTSLASLGMLIHSASAQMEALVTLDAQEPKLFIVTGISPSGLTVQLPGNQSGSLTLGLDKLSKVEFSGDKTWRDALDAKAAGKPTPVLETLRAMTIRIRPFLTLSSSNAQDFYFAYPEALNAVGKHKEALAFLETTPPSSASGILARNAILKAYTLTALGKMDEAKAVLLTVAQPSRTSSLYMLHGITNGRILIHNKDFVGAVDSLARITAQRRITSDGFPELQLLLADAYEALQAAITAQREAIAKSPELAALAKISPEDAIAKARSMESESATISAIMGSPPTEFESVPVSIRRAIVKLWPDSPWAAIAKAKLPPDAPPSGIPAPGATPPSKTAPAAKPTDQTPGLLVPDEDDKDSTL